MALRLFHVRRLFLKPIEQAIQQPTSSLPVRLPPELLSLIVSYVIERRDLHSLCLTCKMLYYTSRTALYKVINTRTPARRSQSKFRVPGAVILNEASHEKLYQTIEMRGFCEFVTEFRIYRMPCNGRSQPSRTWFRNKCTCDRFDAMLGQVLLSLVNLRSLNLVCNSCLSSRDRHHYLKELRTKQLEVLLFYCFCSSHYISDLVEILNAACMSSIRSLNLPYAFQPTNWSKLATKGCLPNLKKVACGNLSPLHVLCSKATISHLGYNTPISTAGDEDALHEIIKQSSRRLSYLYLRQNSYRVPRFIQMDVTPYLSLRHFGQLHFGAHNISSVQISDSISSLAYLPQLFSIQISIQLSGEQISDNEVSIYLTQFTNEMTQMLAIQKIYVTVSSQIAQDSILYEGWTWELQEGHWKVQRLDSYTPWDMMIDSS